jgi:hypothetical protein
MITLFFAVMMISVFGRLLIWGIKAAWGLEKMLFSLIILPLFLIGLVCAGLIYAAVAILIVCGVVVLLGSVVVR